MTHEARFRLRDYLTRDEVAQLLRAAKKGPRHRARSHAKILLAYRHGLRASELVGLRLSDLDINADVRMSLLWLQIEADRIACAAE